MRRQPPLVALLGALGHARASLLAPTLPPDMAMLEQPTSWVGGLGQGGPPPPACPPNCVPPIPKAAGINCTFVQPSATSRPGGPRLDNYQRTGHYVCAPAAAAGKPGPGAGRLLLFFTGTAPSDNTLFLQTAASLGFHVRRTACPHPYP